MTPPPCLLDHSGFPGSLDILWNHASPEPRRGFPSVTGGHAPACWRDNNYKGQELAHTSHNPDASFPSFPKWAQDSPAVDQCSRYFRSSTAGGYGFFVGRPWSMKGSEMQENAVNPLPCSIREDKKVGICSVLTARTGAPIAKAELGSQMDLFHLHEGRCRLHGTLCIDWAVSGKHGI